MKIHTYKLAITVFILFALSGASFSRVAASEVGDMTIESNETWQASTSNPYIITGKVVIPPAVTLTIEPGAQLEFQAGTIEVHGTLSIGSASSTSAVHIGLQSQEQSAISVSNGELDIGNTTVEGGTSFIEASNGGTVAITASMFKNATGNVDYIQAYGNSSLTVDSSTFDYILSKHVIESFTDPKLTIKNSQFTHSGKQATVSVYNGAVANGSFAHVSDSTFDSDVASSIESYGKVPLTVRGTSFIHVAGTAVSLFSDAVASITESTFTDNEIAIEAYNTGTTSVTNSNIENGRSAGMIVYGHAFDAANVWWGDVSGPQADSNLAGKGASVTPDVHFDPWLRDRWAKNIGCCSSVLFIPGLEGSRLYKKGVFFENQLWEPNRNGDVQKLFLDETGKSIDSSIYTRDIILKTNIAGGSILDLSVYDGFAKSLDDLVTAKSIKEWRALPYDWRFSPDTIMMDGIKTSTTTLNVISIVEQMASSSKNGKVAIVAHSNGGLFAKVLVKALQDAGKQNLVDKLILVAVPEFGTPLTIPSSLHGDDQEYGKGFLMNKNIGRQLGINMPTTYNLLPSSKFFTTNFSIQPVIDIATSTILQNSLSGLYGNIINSKLALDNLLLATKGERQNKNLSNLSLDQMAVLNASLISKANAFHAIYDSWIPPNNLQVISIIGTGVSTVSGVTYVDNGGSLHPERKATISKSGDGIALAGEPNLRTGTVFRLDLNKMNSDLEKNFKHVDIMNSNPVKSFVTQLVLNSAIPAPSSLPQYVFGDQKIAATKPPYVYSVYSPVTIEAVDAAGNHTGITSNPDSDEFDFLREEIPNSKYISVGEGKQVILENAAQSIQLKGTDVGTFTFTAETPTVSGSSTFQRFEDIPVTPLATAEIVSSSTSLVLNLDRDGDGKIDEVIFPKSSATTTITKKDISNFLDSLRKEIKVVVLDKERQKRYLKRLDELDKLFKQDDIKKMQGIIDSTIKHIGSKIKDKVKNKDMKANIDRTFLYERYVQLKKLVDGYK